MKAVFFFTERLGNSREIKMRQRPETLTKTFLALGITCGALSGCGGGGGSNSSPGAIRSSIVFQSNRDGDYEILRMRDDGSGVTRVTNNSLNDVEPAFSHDGTRIAYVSPRGGNNELFLVDANGTQQLTHNTFNDDKPSFSPDGSKIVFSSNRNGLIDLFLLDLTTREETQLTFSQSSELDPTFTPDGKILYSSLRNGLSRIFEIDPSGGASTLVPNDLNANQFLPDVSPDGKLMAYASDFSGSLGIYLMDRTTNVSRLLVTSPQGDTGPSFSRDGSHLFFYSTRTGNEDIFSVNLDGTELKDLTNNPASDRTPSAG